MSIITKFQLVVFDMAGTTVADPGHVTNSFISAFGQFDLLITPAAAAQVMGYRKKEAIRLLLEKQQGSSAGNQFELAENIHDAFIQNMMHHYETDRGLQPLPGAERLFETLRGLGIYVALNTGFVKTITGVILRRLGWEDGRLVNAVISSDEVSNARPDAEMIVTLMRRLQVADTAVVAKVGDTGVDVEEGRNAGCGLVAGITTGAFTREQLLPYRPDAVIDSLDELLPLLTYSTTAA